MDSFNDVRGVANQGSNSGPPVMVLNLHTHAHTYAQNKQFSFN